MVGDDPDDERDPDEQNFKESFHGKLTLADMSYTNAELGLPDSSSSDDTD
jgi:hypothetical protein